MEGEENLAPPFRPSRRLFPGEMRHIFEASIGSSSGSGTASQPLPTYRSSQTRQQQQQQQQQLPGPLSPFVVIRDDVGSLNTRETEVSASFFAALTPPVEGLVAQCSKFQLWNN
jgi:hypothetical protein